MRGAALEQPLVVRDDERLAVDDKADVGKGDLVEDGVDGFALVDPALGMAADSRA
jgi:hypothetical protein